MAITWTTVKNSATWSRGNTSDAISGIGNYLAQKSITDNNNRWVAYRNKVRDMQTAYMIDTIKRNKEIAQSDHVNKNLSIQRKHLQATAAAKARAAASGTSGASVDSSVNATHRNAGNATYAEQQRFNIDLEQLNMGVVNAKYGRDLAREQDQVGPSVFGLLLDQSADYFDRKLDELGSDGLVDKKKPFKDKSSLFFHNKLSRGAV